MDWGLTIRFSVLILSCFVNSLANLRMENGIDDRFLGTNNGGEVGKTVSY